MATIYDDVFLGTTEKYNQKLEMLAKMAQPEKWTYKRIQDSDPYRILRNYIPGNCGDFCKKHHAGKTTMVL